MKLILKRDRFTAATRMTHTFGETAQIADPMGRRTFEVTVPNGHTTQHTPPITVQKFGEHKAWGEPRSPVAKARGGHASINGPAIDDVAMFAMPVPTGTKRRGGPPKTDK